MTFRIKLIFDAVFGINNCWYPVDTSKNITIDQIIKDLMVKFGLQELILELDGFRFLGDGNSRHLLKDNDQIHVRSLSRLMSQESIQNAKIIHSEKDESPKNLERDLAFEDFVDSADEYCSESSEGSCKSIKNGKLESPTITSFHLSINSKSVIQDQDSSDSESNHDQEQVLDSRHGPAENTDLGQELSTLKKNDQSLEKLVSTDSKIAQVLEKESPKISKNIPSPIVFEEKKTEDLGKDRLVYYNGQGTDHLRVVINEAKEVAGQKDLLKFYKLAKVLKDRWGYWVCGSSILNDLPKRFFEEYGFISWKKYLEHGQKNNVLEFRTVRGSNIELKMNDQICREILQSCSSHETQFVKNQRFNVTNGSPKNYNAEINGTNRRRSQIQSSESGVAGSPTKYLNNLNQDRKVLIQPRFPAPQQIIQPTPLNMVTQHESSKNSGKWGINDQFDSHTTLKKGNDRADFDKSSEHITTLVDHEGTALEDFSKSKSLTEQYKCFIDLAKYCQNYAPDEWIPGNDFISKNQNFYKKYGQSRWKTYLDWGKKLQILDFRLIRGELNVKMSLEAREMIIHVSNYPFSFSQSY